MPEKSIVDFIKEHHLLTLGTAKKNIPYCSNVFYIYDEKNNSLIFSSDIKTRHAQEFSENVNVAGAIVLETRDVKKIQGVQLLGKINQLNGERLEEVNIQYLNTYPYARKMNPILWEMELTYIKMTHNQLEFGKKLVWKK